MTAPKKYINNIFLTILFLHGIQSSSGQPRSSPDNLIKTNFIPSDFKAADSILKYNKFFSALIQYKKLARRFKKENNQPAYIYALVGSAKCYYGLENYTFAKTKLRQALSLYETNSKSNPYVLSEIYFYLGKYYYQINNPDSAINLINHSIEQKQKIYSANDVEMGKVHSALGNVYRYLLYNYSEAERHYLKHLTILNGSKAVELHQYISVYYNLATTNRLKGDFAKAILYAQKALNLSKNIPKSHQKKWQENIHSVLANIYIDKEEYSISIYHQKQAIRFNASTGILTTLCINYNNIGESYLFLKNYRQAKIFLAKALKTSKYIKNKDLEADCYLNIGRYNVEIRKHDLAKMSFDKALALKESVYGISHPEIAKCYYHLGNLYSTQGAPDSALSLYQRTFKSEDVKVNLYDIFSNPTPATLINNQFQLAAMSLKAAELRRYYKTNKNIKYLEASLSCYILLDSVIEKKKRQTEDYFIMSGNLYSKKIYDEAIECCFALNQIKKDIRYVQLAFSFIEKTKANVLKENLKGALAFAAIDVPEAIQSEERKLKSLAIFYENKLLNVDKSAVRSSDIELLNNKLFEISQKLDDLKQRILKKYPVYYKIKYKTPSLNLREIQIYAADKNIQFIEYQLTDNELFIIGINQNEIKFIKISDIKKLKSNIEEFIHTIQLPKSEYLKSTNFYNFINASYNLYKTLIFPFAESANLNSKLNLVIIPDGNLHLLPFDALIKNLPHTSNVDFQHLAYLINHYNFKYAYSLDFYFSKQSGLNDDGKPAIIAFNYTSKNTASRLPILRGSKTELDNISKVMKGRFFEGNMANEANFKRYAPSADIIHLALHGIADTINPLSSRLVFNNFKEANKNDGILYAYELYSLKLKARLVVLSACATALGKEVKGEGIMSLGRAFRYAGCSNLIVSLWNIPDKTTARLMGGFYKGLSLEKSSGAALNDAKRLFIEEGDEIIAHPKNWAGFILFGDADDVVIKSRTINPSVIVGYVLVLILIILVIAFKKRLLSKSK